MEYVTLIVDALAAGAGAGLQASANKAVQQSYDGLKTAMSHLMKKSATGTKALRDLSQQDPDGATMKRAKDTLLRELSAMDVREDEDLVRHARLVLHAANNSTTGLTTNSMVSIDSQAVMNGNSNVQHNQFGAK